MTLKEMRERRAKCAHDMAELANNLTPENKVKFDALDVEQEGIRQTIVAQEKAAALDAEMRQSQGRPPEDQTDPAAAPGTPEERKKKEERYALAFRNYLKYGAQAKPEWGIRGCSEEDRSILSKRTIKIRTDGDIESRDMSEGGPPFGAYPGTTTGFFVPVGFVMKIEEALKYYGNMLNVADEMQTATGQPLPYPTDNDTAVTGEIIGENQQVSTADVSLGQIMFGAWKFSTKMVKVSIELLQDSAFDLESFLSKKFAIRLGRILNTKFTIGSGTGEPNGIITAATVGVGQSTTPAIVGDDNQTSPDPTQQIGYIDMVNLEHSVDPLYRMGAQYMMHDQTLRFIKTLKDKFGRPLWVPAVNAGTPDTILSYRYSVNNDMAQLAAGNITMAFGQLSKYMIRKVRDLQVLRLEERFADFGQIAFLGFYRSDGQLLDAGTHPVKYIQQHS